MAFQRLVMFRLREQQEQLEREHHQELDMVQKTGRECSVKLESLQALLAEKEVMAIIRIKT